VTKDLKYRSFSILLSGMFCHFNSVVYWPFFDNLSVSLFSHVLCIGGQMVRWTERVFMVSRSYITYVLFNSLPYIRLCVHLLGCLFWVLLSIQVVKPSKDAGAKFNGGRNACSSNI
jgi:hypothetical protein